MPRQVPLRSAAAAATESSSPRIAAHIHFFSLTCCPPSRLKYHAHWRRLNAPAGQMFRGAPAFVERTKNRGGAQSEQDFAPQRLPADRKATRSLLKSAYAE